MNLQEYIQQAQVTNDPTASKERNNLHAGYGLVTEVGEIADIFKRHIFYGKAIDIVNLKEEIGDAMWYLAIGIHARGVDINEVEKPAKYLPGPDKLTDSQNMIMAASNATYVLFSYHRDDTLNSREEVIYLTTLYFCLKSLCHINGFTIEEAMDLNIQKLRKRYPDGFSKYDALNRNKENEMSHFTKETAV